MFIGLSRLFSFRMNRNGLPGAVIATQTFGDFLGFNPHCHISPILLFNAEQMKYIPRQAKTAPLYSTHRKAMSYQLKVSNHKHPPVFCFLQCLSFAWYD